MGKCMKESRKLVWDVSYSQIPDFLKFWSDPNVLCELAHRTNCLD